MILHPEFMRLLKRELSWPLVALVLVISGLGWWRVEADLRAELVEHNVYVNLGSETKQTRFSVNLETQERCIRELMAKAGIENEQADTECASVRRFIYRHHAEYFVGAIAIILLVAAARVVNTMYSDFKHHTWDYQRLGTHAPWRLAFAKITGGAALAFYGLLLNAGIFMMLARTPDIHNLGLMIAMALVVGMAAAVPFLAYTFQVTEGRSASLLLVWGVAICAAVSLNVLLPINLMNMSNFQEFDRHFELAVQDFASLPAMLLVSVVVSGFFLMGAVRLLKSYQTSVKKPWFLLVSVVLLSNYVYFSSAYFALRGNSFRSEGIVGTDNLTLYSFNFMDYMGSYILISFAFAYLTCILGNRSMLRYRRLQGTWRETGRLPWRELPVWTYMLLFAFCTFVLCTFSISIVGKNPQAIVLLLQIFGFVVRDIAILHITTLRRSEGQGDMLALLAFFVLYVMMAGLLPDAYDQLFLPTAETGIAGLLSAWGQATGCLLLLRYIWRRHAAAVPAVATTAPASV